MEKPLLCIVIPCYNEQEVLPKTAPLFLGQLESMAREGLIDEASRIMFVNDGSKDATWELIQGFSRQDPRFTGICLSRNRGHQNALLAGLMEAKDLYDVTISIDCDGQDDINAMSEMARAYLDGCEIVYGVRSNRDSDTFFKRFTAQSYYRLLAHMGGEVVYNHADYRLVSSRVLQEFSNFREVNIFLRGMFPMVGFKSTCVYYERHERIAGESHYPLAKMLGLAFDGITSMSVKPIRIISGMGIFFAMFAMVLIIYVLVSYFSGHVVPGWSSNVIATCMIGGIQLISLGVIGEYVGKIYMETKARPRYIISERTQDRQNGEKYDDCKRLQCKE